MPAMKICKVCGAQYEYCHTITTNVFRWQDVACCKEHGIKYFDLINKMRSGKDTVTVSKPESAKSIEDEVTDVTEIISEDVTEVTTEVTNETAAWSGYNKKNKKKR